MTVKFDSASVDSDLAIYVFTRVSMRIAVRGDWQFIESSFWQPIIDQEESATTKHSGLGDTDNKELSLLRESKRAAIDLTGRVDKGYYY